MLIQDIITSFSHGSSFNYQTNFLQISHTFELVNLYKDAAKPTNQVFRGLSEDDCENSSQFMVKANQILFERSLFKFAFRKSSLMPNLSQVMVYMK